MSCLPMFQIVTAILAFFLHFIAICTSYWINLYSRNAINSPLDGHVGLWFVCFKNLFAAGYDNYRQEFCDPIDRIFRPSPYSSLALVLGISVLVTIFLYVPSAIISRNFINSPSSYKSCSRYAGRFKVALAIISIVLVILILIFVSIRQQEIMPTLNTRNFRSFRSSKGYSFYLETSVAFLLIVLTIVGIKENRRLSNENVTSF